MIEYIVIALLSASTGLFIVLFLRAKKLYRALVSDEKAVKSWLQVHQDLQKASNAVIEIRRVDVDAIWYREPTR